jgi:hypothetical protein
LEQNKFQDTADVTMQLYNKPLAPSRKNLEVLRVSHDREEKMTADHDDNLESRTPKEDVSRKYLQAERYSSSLSQEQSMSSRAFCVARILCIESMDDFLMLPDTLKRIGKRQT